MQASLSSPVLSREAARKIGLSYVSDREPGIVRKPSGRYFRYLDSKGSRVHDTATLERIRRLVIPPAWTEVWICPREDGHLQAVGRDARRRKQYRYHDSYRQIRDETKFTRMAAFGVALPKIRAQIQKDLSSRGMCKQKILAAIVQLLDSVAIRIGNEDYARQNDSFGLTTLRNDHVEVTGQTIHFHFRGKSGQLHKMKLTDRRLAGIVRKCQCLPGQELFLYEDAEGQIVKIHSDDVNEYLDGLAKEKFTAKDFRTWKGTTEMIVALQQLGPAENQTEAKEEDHRSGEDGFSKVRQPSRRVPRLLHSSGNSCCVHGRNVIQHSRSRPENTDQRKRFAARGAGCARAGKSLHFPALYLKISSTSCGRVFCGRSQPTSKNLSQFCAQGRP